MNNTTYLAAPFFNPEQIRIVESIEGIYVGCGRPLFSPRLQDQGTGPKKILTEEDASRIFNNNYAAIRQCTAMVAVLDWLMPEGQLTAVINKVHDEAQIMPINIPDTGTVMEMGMAYTLGIPIFGYTERSPEGKMNIMLAKACTGFLIGEHALFRFLMEKVYTARWPGRFQ